MNESCPGDCGNQESVRTIHPHIDKWRMRGTRGVWGGTESEERVGEGGKLSTLDLNFKSKSTPTHSPGISYATPNQLAGPCRTIASRANTLLPPPFPRSHLCDLSVARVRSLSHCFSRAPSLPPSLAHVLSQAVSTDRPYHSCRVKKILLLDKDKTLHQFGPGVGLMAEFLLVDKEVRNTRLRKGPDDRFLLRCLGA
jgi:hypothetical protein